MLEANIGTPEKYTTIYSGMEVEPFLDACKQREEVRRKLGYSPEDVVIGKVARFFHLKGHEDVIEAAATVVRENPRVRFLFIGNGILRESLQRRIAALGLESHFQFTGLVPPDELPPYFAAMDVLVHASLREGLARVLPQALLAGDAGRELRRRRCPVKSSSTARRGGWWPPGTSPGWARPFWKSVSMRGCGPDLPKRVAGVLPRSSAMR